MMLMALVLAEIQRRFHTFFVSSETRYPIINATINKWGLLA